MVTDTLVQINLQSILNLTVIRLLSACKIQFEPETRLQLISKWGFDGASNQSMYKQRFQRKTYCKQIIQF